MEYGIAIVFSIVGLIVGFKALSYLNKAEDYIDMTIEESTAIKELQMRENVTKRIEKLKTKYGKTGLLTREDIREAGGMDFRVNS